MNMSDLFQSKSKAASPQQAESLQLGANQNTIDPYITQMAEDKEISDESFFRMVAMGPKPKEPTELKPKEPVKPPPPTYDIDAIANSIIPFEVIMSLPTSWGYNEETRTYFPYDDSRGNLTAGIGGKIDGDREQKAREQLEQVAPDIDFDDFKNGITGITREHVQKIFMMNVEEHIKRAENHLVELDNGMTAQPFKDLINMPTYMQEAVVNGVFWSMLTYQKSPKTMKLISAGKWEEASKEFLLGKWQREMEEAGGSTWDRFVLISDALSKYGKEVEYLQWYKTIAAIQGLNPDPNHPLHYYDYRAAYDSGIRGPDKETGHWDSKFKLEGHPRTIVDGVNTITGEIEEEEKKPTSTIWWSTKPPM